MHSPVCCLAYHGVGSLWQAVFQVGIGSTFSTCAVSSLCAFLSVFTFLTRTLLSTRILHWPGCWYQLSMTHWPRSKKFVSWCLLLHILGIEEVAIVVTFQPLDETGTSNGSLCQLVIRLQICYSNSAMCELASGLCRCKVKLFRCGQRVLQEGLTLSMPWDDYLIIGLSFERWQCFSRRNVCCSGIIFSGLFNAQWLKWHDCFFVKPSSMCDFMQNPWSNFLSRATKKTYFWHTIQMSPRVIISTFVRKHIRILP